jgi:multiple sugar transport system permease protein
MRGSSSAADSQGGSQGRLKGLARDLLLVVISVVSAFPLFWMAWTAFKPADLAYQPGAIDFTPTLESFQLVVGESRLLLYLFNTFVVASTTTLLSLFVVGLVAYSIARFDTGGRKLYIGVLLPVMIPPVTLAVPLFFMFNYVGLVNTRPAIVVAQLSFGIPFAVWFLTDFFRQLPVEIEEAAMIDGDTRLEAIAFALVPNIKNGVFAAGILIFIYSWNNFLFPLLLASGEAVRTLPVEINNYDTFEGLLISRMSAAIIVTIVPVLLLAFVAQRYLVEGIAAGSGID